MRAGIRRTAGLEEPPPCILERMHDAVIEAEVADVVADDHIDPLGKSHAVGMSRG